MIRREASVALPAVSESDDRLYGAFRRALLTDLGSDFRLGFKLAYFYNFASPAIATALAASGEIDRQPMRRAKDTSIVVYEIIANGFDSDRGRAMIDLLTRVHRGVPGSNEDFLYVLMTLFVVPIRAVERVGRRRLTAIELAQAGAFFARLGHSLDLDSVTSTYAEASAFCARYEQESVAASAEGRALTDATLGALVVSAPPVAKPFIRAGARLGFGALIGDPRISAALGLPAVPLRVRRALFAVRRFGRRRARSSTVAFTSGEASRVYPDGYGLDEIGPGAGRGTR